MRLVFWLNGVAKSSMKHCLWYSQESTNTYHVRKQMLFLAVLSWVAWFTWLPTVIWFGIVLLEFSTNFMNSLKTDLRASPDSHLPHLLTEMAKWFDPSTLVERVVGSSQSSDLMKVCASTLKLLAKGQSNHVERKDQNRNASISRVFQLTIHKPITYDDRKDICLSLNRPISQSYVFQAMLTLLVAPPLPLSAPVVNFDYLNVR